MGEHTSRRLVLGFAIAALVAASAPGLAQAQGRGRAAPEPAGARAPRPAESYRNPARQAARRASRRGSGRLERERRNALGQVFGRSSELGRGPASELGRGSASELGRGSASELGRGLASELGRGANRPELRAARRGGAADLRQTGERLATLRSQLERSGLRAGELDQALVHVELGMPTPASRENPSDYLVARDQYVISYNRERRNANWAAWHLTASDMGDAPRSENFHSDPILPQGWTVAQPSDYKRSGYTRGHLVASGERTSNTDANHETFLLSNVVPQTYENNAGPWQSFETYYRDLAQSGKKDVYLFAGGIYDGSGKTIGADRVAVPSATWKVAVMVDPGTPIEKIDGSARVVSIVVPNRPGAVKLDQTFEQFRVRPSEIERATGIELFTNLPESVRGQLVEKLDTEVVPVHYVKGYKAAEIKKRGGQLPANVQLDPNEGRPNRSQAEPTDWNHRRRTNPRRNRGQQHRAPGPAVVAPWNRPSAAAR